MNEGEGFEELEELSEKDRKAESRKLLDIQNDRAREAFERKRENRSDRLGTDQHIRNIASHEVNKLSQVVTALVIAHVAHDEYGWPGLIVVALGAFLLSWRADKKQKKLPQYKIEDVDDLASDSVTHERIADLEEAGKKWLVIRGKYAEDRYIFDHPYWESVNMRVRQYVGMSNSDRVADNKAARARSLPYRKAMIAKLTTDKFWELDKELDLPSWAQINFGE